MDANTLVYKQQKSINFMSVNGIFIGSIRNVQYNQIGNMKGRMPDRLQSADGVNKQYLAQSLEQIPNFTDRHCRICLEQQGQLIQLPCGCIGEMGLTHQKCFTQWIQSLRNERSPFHRRARSLTNVQSNIYEIPCEICKRNIKLEIQEKTQLISCKQQHRSKLIFSIISIILCMAVMGIVAYFCISGIIRSGDSGVRIFINAFIMLILFLVLGWILKREAQSLFVKNIMNLKIVTDRSKYQQGQNQIFHFEIEDKKKEDRNADLEQNRSNSSRNSSRRRRRNRNRNLQ